MAGLSLLVPAFVLGALAIGVMVAVRNRVGTGIAIMLTGVTLAAISVVGWSAVVGSYNDAPTAGVCDERVDYDCDGILNDVDPRPFD